MSKTLEVTVVRRIYTTYEVEVADDFDVNANGVFGVLEDDFFNHFLETGEGWREIDEEVASWDVDDAREVQ